MVKNVLRGLVKAGLVSGSQQSVQQDVVRLERGVGFQLSAPIAFFVLLRKKIFARGVSGHGDAAAEIIDLAKTHLGERGGGFRASQFRIFSRTFFRTVFRTMRGRFFHRVLQIMSPQQRQALPQS